MDAEKRIEGVTRRLADRADTELHLRIAKLLEPLRDVVGGCKVSLDGVKHWGVTYHKDADDPIGNPLKTHELKGWKVQAEAFLEGLYHALFDFLCESNREQAYTAFMEKFAAFEHDLMEEEEIPLPGEEETSLLGDDED